VAASLLHDISPAVFWICLGLLAFTFAGYPLWIALLARGKDARPARTTPASPPTITAIVVAHNESKRLAARIENLLASDYPADKLTVLVVSDGSTDDTVALVENLRHPRVRVLPLATRGGKPGGLNAGVAACESDLIVFADARQTFAPDAISRLAAWFDDPKFGAVSGELEIAAAQSGTGAGVGAYWKLERFLRRKEAALDSCVGCSGAIYAIRRSLYTALPADTILDDVVIPMRFAIAGHRVGHDGDARAFDPQPQEPAVEARRKARTLAGNFQMLFRHPGWLLPWRNRLWWRLIAHKYLRLAAPPLLALLLAASAVLWRHPLYLAALLLQVGFYLLALIGLTTHMRNQIFSVPAGFVFLNATVVRAFFKYLSGSDLARWHVARS
jgi:cellulose synthase/poly-beta-1,6-N-acetylglucosamine synthase-like glycosyltransferase